MTMAPRTRSSANGTKVTNGTTQMNGDNSDATTMGSALLDGTADSNNGGPIRTEVPRKPLPEQTS